MCRDGARPFKEKTKRWYTAEAAKALEQQSCQSELHDLLMLLLAQGLLSAGMVHRIAKAAVKDIAKARDGYWVPDLEKYLGFDVGRIYKSPGHKVGKDSIHAQTNGCGHTSQRPST